MDSPAPMTPDCSCLNCGAALAGPFCHACGQRDQPEDLPAREIARGALGDLFTFVTCTIYAALAVRRCYGVSAGKGVVSAPAVTVAPLVACGGIIVAGLMLVVAWPS